MKMQGVDSFVQSPNIGGETHGKRKVAIIFHDTESPESMTGAEDVQAFFARSATQASTNATIDADTIAGSVDYDQIPWHTGAGSPHNWTCEGYEHVGRASQDRAAWLDAFGIAMLERSARFFAWRCHELGIPPRRIDADQYLRALAANDPSQGGIMGHIDITIAANVRGGHTDPGPQFPWDYYIARVRRYYDGGEDDDMPSEQRIWEIVNQAVHDGIENLATNKQGNVANSNLEILTAINKLTESLFPVVNQAADDAVRQLADNKQGDVENSHVAIREDMKKYAATAATAAATTAAALATAASLAAADRDRRK